MDYAPGIGVQRAKIYFGFNDNLHICYKKRFCTYFGLFLCTRVIKLAYSLKCFSIIMHVFGKTLIGHANHILHELVQYFTYFEYLFNYTIIKHSLEHRLEHSLRNSDWQHMSRMNQAYNVFHNFNYWPQT